MADKVSISERQIQEMADELQNGFNIYLNTETGEFRALSDLEQLSPEGLIQAEEHRKITDHWDHYMIICCMETWELFEVMEEFMFEVDREFHYRLLDAMYRKNPIENFQYLVETSSYRDSWFAFKNRKYLGYVKDYLKAEGIDMERSS